MSSIIPVVLCGGSGTRLWPLSRSDRPKQSVTLAGGQSLLEGTLLRARAITGASDPICVTAAAYREDVRQSLERLGLRGRLLIEPMGRNTAPALTGAALLAMQTDPEAIIVALPADHIIEEGEAFAASIARACAVAEQGWLTVLGVRPRHASADLGYIVPDVAISGLPGAVRVNRFIEKPTPEVAQSLVDAGAFWNAGIVVARAEQIIATMRRHEPSILAAVERALVAGEHLTDDVCLDETEFAAAPSLSFDKAVLERHETVAVTALDAAWRDVGTWAEVAELYPPDPEGNRQSGRVHLSSSRDSFVLSLDRLVVGIGLKDLIVVDTPGALLIVNRNDLGLVRGVLKDMTTASNADVESSD